MTPTDGELALEREPAPDKDAQQAFADYEARIALRALAERREALKKLAGKAEAEGYGRQAREVLGDATIITDRLVPQFQAQLTEPLFSDADVRAGIAEAFRDMLAGALEREHVAGLQRGKRGEEEAIAPPRRTDLEVVLGRIADRVERFARAVADRSYAAGVSARNNTAEAALFRSLDALRPDPEG